MLVEPPFTSCARAIWRVPVYREPIEYADTTPGPLQCPVCGIGQVRAFINVKDYEAQVLKRVEQIQ